MASRIVCVDQMLMGGICGGKLVKVKSSDFNKEMDGWNEENELLESI